jgi:hypothetical protein
MSDFSILKKAGISITDAAKLFGICRSTVHDWVIGRPARTQSIQLRALSICKAIESAVDKGLFPLKGVRRAEKLGVLRRVIAAEMTSLSR